MPNKLTKFIFHVTADNGVDAEAIIAIDHVEVWNGKLKHTLANLQTMDLSTITSKDTVDVYCDINLPTNNTKLELYHKLISIQVYHGTVMFVGLAQSNNPVKLAVPNPSDPGGTKIMLQAGGSAEPTLDYFIATQPLWNNMVDLTRYNFASRVNEHCPGTILINHNETCEFTVALWGYCPNFFWL